MIDVSATATVRCSAEDVIAFVLDVEQYRKVDRKIGRILKTEVVDGDHVVTFKTAMRGLPARARERMHVVGVERIEVSPMPSWQDKVMQFRGLFELTSVSGGVRVRHAYQFDFRPPMKRFIEPYIRSWITRGIEQEVQDLKTALESQAATS